MKDTIEHLKDLVSAADKSDHLYEEQAAALEFTRDYGAKLIAVVEAGRRLVESAITQADILADGSIVPTKCSVDPEEFDKFQDALAALEGDV
jgi:S-adenosylmethionine:tRNA-ribosyltransferase-isomerase (queuine synthetase)